MSGAKVRDTAESDARCWRSECRTGCYYPQACSERPVAVCGHPSGEVMFGRCSACGTRVIPPGSGDAS